MFYLILYPQCLKYCQAYNICSINIWGLSNEYVSAAREIRSNCRRDSLPLHTEDVLDIWMDSWIVLLAHSTPRVSLCMYTESLQLCPTLCDPMDCSLPGSSVRVILQARIPEWVAMPSFRGSSQPRDRTQFSSVSCIASRFFIHWANLGRPPASQQTLFLSLKLIKITNWSRKMWSWGWQGPSHHCSSST